MGSRPDDLSVPETDDIEDTPSCTYPVQSRLHSKKDLECGMLKFAGIDDTRSLAFNDPSKSLADLVCSLISLVKQWLLGKGMYTDH